MPDRIDPYKNFNFIVSLGERQLGGFQVLTGLDTNDDASDHRHEHAGPGAKQPVVPHPNLMSLQRGLVDPSVLQPWVHDRAPRDITIQLHSSPASGYLWRVYGARVVKCLDASLPPDPGDAVIEELELSFERAETTSS